MKNLTNKSLTVELAKSLKGQKIKTRFSGYAGQGGDEIFVVGEILSSYDLAKREPIEGFASRAEMWDAQLSAQRLKELKSTLEILREDGTPTYIRSHNFRGVQDSFTCSDIDRYVSFEIIK